MTWCTNIILIFVGFSILPLLFRENIKKVLGLLLFPAYIHSIIFSPSQWLFLPLLPTRPRQTLLCTQPFLLVVFPAPQSTSFQTSSASACLISGRFLCFFFIFSLWLRYLTAVRAAHGWHDYCVNPPQYIIYRPLCLIRECPAVASLEFYFHFFYRIFLRKRKLSSAYQWKSPNYAM